MKNITRITFTTLLFAAASFAVADAQTAANTPAAPAATAPHAGGGAKLLRRAMIRRHIAHKLGLSADEIAQLKTQRTAAVAAVKSIRADSSLTPEQKKAKIRETVQATRTQMRAVLTPEQLAKWDAMRANMKKAHNG